MNFKVVFPTCFSIGLLGLSGLFHSPAFAYASVLALVVVLFRDIVEQKVFAVKDIKLTIPDEFKKAINDLGVRLTTLEYERVQRGF